jgi:hypothetical protein
LKANGETGATEEEVSLKRKSPLPTSKEETSPSPTRNSNPNPPPAATPLKSEPKKEVDLTFNSDSQVSNYTISKKMVQEALTKIGADQQFYQHYYKLKIEEKKKEQELKTISDNTQYMERELDNIAKKQTELRLSYAEERALSSKKKDEQDEREEFTSEYDLEGDEV